VTEDRVADAIERVADAIDRVADAISDAADRMAAPVADLRLDVGAILEAVAEIASWRDPPDPPPGTHGP
jgi:hypothetical protein